MSLIQTLINKGFHAYQQMKAEQSPAVPTRPTDGPEGPVHQDDADAPVQLSGAPVPRPRPEQTVRAWQREIGQAIAGLQNVLRQKVAEYRLPPQTDLNVRPEADRVVLEAAIPEPVRSAIEADLNRDAHFRSTLQAVWKGKPALDTLQNVVRLQSAYGSSNRVFNPMLEQPAQTGGLTELAQRFEQLSRAPSGGAAVN